MQLKELISGYNGELKELNVTSITSDSRKVEKDSAFVCISGPINDGHSYAKDALEKGASVVITQRDLNIKSQIIVDDTVKTFADMCSKWFGEPQKKLRLFGVTGTNGKTSVSYMLKSIFEADGNKVGLIGTIQNVIGSDEQESTNTTPGCYELYELLSKMVDSGCTHCVMEVSSHALDQRRVEGLEFEVGMFTNLTVDHLDYHKTMEQYLEAKKKLFYISKTAVVNFDDSVYNEITSNIPAKVVSYSTVNDEADYIAKNINFKPASTEFEFVGYETIKRVKLKIGGKFTVFNAMCAITAAISAGVSLETAVDGINRLEAVKGRCEKVETGKDFSVIIDYAHTPDGLLNILKTFSDCNKNRLIVLFGCGGDRDTSKRSIMGEIASTNSDYVIITSDNPRTESPEKIIEDILVGTKRYKTPYKVLVNREEAIEYAIKIARNDDIIVLAGKGHETYQILKDGKIHFDEREIIARAISKLK